MAKMYERIQEQCDLAVTYAEDGAYQSAARVLREIAIEVKAHADRVYAAEPQPPMTTALDRLMIDIEAK